MYAINQQTIDQLSGPQARPFLIGMIMAFVAKDGPIDMTDAERLDAIRAALATYVTCQHQISGAPGFGAR